MGSVVGGDAYRSAMRSRLVGATLTDAEHEVLEAGRIEQGYPAGRYPLPLGTASAAPRPPAEPAPLRPVQAERVPPRCVRWTRWLDERNRE